MNAVYSKENCATRIGVEPKMLLESLKNFQVNVELTLISQQQGLTIKNAVEDGSWGPDTDLLKDGQTRTEIKLHSDELVSYHVDPRFAAAGISISFLQKEFRALLQLVHEIEHRIDIFIEAGGKPIIFGSAPRRDTEIAPFSMECVLATVEDTEANPFGDDGDFFGDEAPADGMQADDGTTQQHPSAVPSQQSFYASQNWQQQHQQHQQHQHQQHQQQLPSQPHWQPQQQPSQPQWQAQQLPPPHWQQPPPQMLPQQWQQQPPPPQQQWQQPQRQPQPPWQQPPQQQWQPPPAHSASPAPQWQPAPLSDVTACSSSAGAASSGVQHPRSGHSARRGAVDADAGAWGRSAPAQSPGYGVRTPDPGGAPAWAQGASRVEVPGTPAGSSHTPARMDLSGAQVPSSFQPPPYQQFRSAQSPHPQYQQQAPPAQQLPSPYAHPRHPQPHESPYQQPGHQSPWAQPPTGAPHQSGVGLKRPADDGSDTEEDEDAVPGTPPDSPSQASKRSR